MSTHQQLCRQFTLDEIKEATNNFDDEQIIGQGGFGKVYRGAINYPAKLVAIKRLSLESHQGETEFWREIEMLSRVRHDNLVCLEGYCNESPEKILVYEYMPNGTVVDHLYKTRGSATNIGENQPYHLTWEERLNISIGAAQGLDFLHKGVVPGIIHRDIKDSNILLDSNLIAKIADFGLAKLVKATNDPMITSVSTTLVKGTFGYLDPEYFYTQRLTTKTDVYAFGVVLLVLLSGRPAVDNKAVEDERSLAEWAMKCVAKKRLDLIIDPDLDLKSSSKSLQQFVKVVHKCLCRQSEQRPTMKEVVAGLELALKKQPTTPNTSSSQSGAMSSLTQMASWWNVKFDTQKKNTSATQGSQIHSESVTTSENYWGASMEYHYGISNKVLNDITRRLLKGKGGKPVQLSEAEIRMLCASARQIFLSEPMLLEVQAPIKICGDIHGQYHDLLRIFEAGGFPPSVAYLFLGNYVDYGRQSLETIWLLLAYKILYPDKVFLLRGNHEDAKLNRTHGFYDECKRRYNVRVWKTFTDCFNCLPVAALVNDKIFCVHGGLSPDLKDIKQIEGLPRPSDIPDSGLLCDLLWSDPKCEIKGWAMSDRDYSFTFGADKVAEFLLKNDFDLICRGHQVVEGGFEFFADRELVTIFSAPNYSRGIKNSGAIMSVDESLMCSFEIYRIQTKLIAGISKLGFGNDPIFGERNNEEEEDDIEIMMEKQKEMTRVQKVLNDIITRLWEVKVGKESENIVQNEDWEKGVQLSEAEIRLLCIKAGHIFLSESSLLEVQAPIEICGIVNGEYQRLLEMFEFVGLPPSVAYLFLGNYDSLETIWLLLAYKILYPDKVFLLRGNHEGANKEGNYRFYAKCRNKFSENLWETFTDCFNCLPVAALVGGKIFCVHGGLSPELKHIKQINELPRPTEIPNKGLLQDLLTSHPSTNKGWGNGDGGDLCSFGEDKVAGFLQTNGLDLICRCSQQVEYGGQRDFVFFANRGLVTIPQFNSLGAILSIDKKLKYALRRLTFRKRPRDAR